MWRSASVWANVIVVMTADHGVAPVPEVLVEQKMPGGRIAPTRRRASSILFSKLLKNATEQENGS